MKKQALLLTAMLGLACAKSDERSLEEKILNDLKKNSPELSVKNSRGDSIRYRAREFQYDGKKVIACVIIDIHQVSPGEQLEDDIDQILGFQIFEKKNGGYEVTYVIEDPRKPLSLAPCIVYSSESDLFDVPFGRPADKSLPPISYNNIKETYAREFLSND